MKKDKDWLSEQVGDLNSTHAVFNESGVSYIDTVVSMERVYELIDQLDEPEVLSQELPVIPKFVADYLEKAKKEINLLRVFEVANGLNELDVWRKEYNWIRLYHLDFARAWLDGYKVEEEPLFYVVDKNDKVLWYRGLGGEPEISGATLKNVQRSNSKKRYQFTEQEIKGYDKRYWPFAEQVEQADFRLSF